MSAFDPAAFLNQTTTESGSTSIEPIPAGEYPALIDKVEPRQVTTKNGPSIVVDVHLLLQDPATAAKIGREKLSVRMSFFPDLASNGGFDMAKGKNVQLNRLREACNLNSPGQAFKLGDLVGKMVKAQVTLREANGAIYNDAKTVGRM